MNDRKQFATFNSKEDFSNYAKVHYISLLTELQFNNDLTTEEKKVIGFLLDDMYAILEQN